MDSLYTTPALSQLLISQWLTPLNLHSAAVTHLLIPLFQHTTIPVMNKNWKESLDKLISKDTKQSQVYLPITHILVSSKPTAALQTTKPFPWSLEVSICK